MERNTTIPAPISVMGEPFRPSEFQGRRSEPPADNRVWKYLVWAAIALLVIGVVRHFAH